MKLLLSIIKSSVVAAFCLPLLVLQTTVAAEDAPIPHGEVAQAKGEGVVAAWYSCPTERYRHGVLGDRIEGGCLHVRDHEEREISVELSELFVFEDTTPRIADMNGDGLNDVVTVRSDVRSGAALAIYGIVDGALQEIAATATIGTANRWLAPAGIADFNNDGRNDVAYVQTPHIGGILRIWSMLDDGFTEIGRINGLSNHAIGATRVSTSLVLDDNGDKVPDLALPDRWRNETIIITLHPEPAILRRAPYEESFYD